jgi:hypothetical protein
MLRGGWEFQEGIAVNFLLVWCGRSATTLVAAGHKVQKYKAKITPGFRLKSIAGMTPYLACAGWNLAILEFSVI